jgi:hypothetical protein
MAQELDVLRAKALPLRPDLIVLQYTINDDHISNWIQPRFPTLNRTIHRSVFLTSMWKRLLYSPRMKTTLLPFVERYVPDLLLYAPGLVGTPISRESDPAHGRPHPPRVREQVPPRYWESAGFQVYSFYDIFNGADVRDYGYDPLNTAGHFTDEGSDFIAKKLAVFIPAHFDLTIRRPRS